MKHSRGWKMNSDYNLDYLSAKEILQTRFNRLNTWQKFIFILWLMGYTQEYIAEHVYVTRQDISYTVIEAKKIMGVYYQWN